MKIKKKLTLEQRPISLDRIPEESGVPKGDSWPMEYVVKKVLGSTIPRVRAVLSNEQVDEYCNDENWEVTIT